MVEGVLGGVLVVSHGLSHAVGKQSCCGMSLRKYVTDQLPQGQTNCVLLIFVTVKFRIWEEAEGNSHFKVCLHFFSSMNDTGN